MAEKMRLWGGARLDGQGVFEMYLGGARGEMKRHWLCEALREHTREYFDFLMSPDNTRQIGQKTATKSRTKTGKTTVSFTWMGGRDDGFEIHLFKGQGEFASLAFDIPVSSESVEPEESPYSTVSDESEQDWE